MALSAKKHYDVRAFHEFPCLSATFYMLYDELMAAGWLVGAYSFKTQRVGDEQLLAGANEIMSL